MSGHAAIRRSASAAAAVLATLVLAGAALAAKPSGSSLTLVVLPASELRAMTASEPAFGGDVTFEVATSQTDRPFVNLRCYQRGTWVYDAWHGFFASYAPDPVFTLSSDYWTAGGASCVADLVTWGNNGRVKTLATTSFEVSP